MGEILNICANRLEISKSSPKIPENTAKILENTAKIPENTAKILENWPKIRTNRPTFSCRPAWSLDDLRHQAQMAFRIADDSLLVPEHRVVLDRRP